MEIKFDKEYLRELYEIGTATDKKHRFQPNIVERYQARIRTLERASKTEDLYTLRSLRYEKLKGDKAGLESIRVNNQYRIEFKTTEVVSETVVTVCNIIELSNHYR
jgi:proteic killer suppression protein